VRRGSKLERAFMSKYTSDKLVDEYQFFRVYTKKGEKTKIVFYRNRMGDHEWDEEYDGPRKLTKGKLKTLKTWLKRRKFPLFGHIIHKLQLTYMHDSKVGFVLATCSNKTACDAYRGALKDPIKRFRKGGFNFGWLYWDNEPEKISATELGVTGNNEMLVVDMKNHPEKTKKNMKILKYNYRGPFTTEGVDGFANKVVGKKAKRFFKGQPVPKNDGVEFEAVASTYWDVVKDETKDVLAVFYAPWCKYCQAYMPQHRDLAAYAKKHFKDVLIVK